MFGKKPQPETIAPPPAEWVQQLEALITVIVRRELAAAFAGLNDDGSDDEEEITKGN